MRRHGSNDVFIEAVFNQMKRQTYTASTILLLVFVFVFISSRQFLSMHHPDPVYPSKGLTRTAHLSDYFPRLKKTPADTPVYIFEGTEPGGRILITGGTHPNEPAGFITPVLLCENITVNRGCIILVPQANRSGFTHTDPFEGNPQRFALTTPNGKRWFRFGSRLTNPVHQWPDPPIYINPAGQSLAGTEIRNLNRTYPGRKHGTLTEKAAYAIMQLIRKERVDLGIDLHEAAPEYPVINAMVFHENTAELAATALMELQMDGVDLRLENSPENLRGLSHREWGDASGIYSILLETANPAQGRLKGRPSQALITEGRDTNYQTAARLGRLFIPFDKKGVPLKVRVSRHLAAVKAVLDNLSMLYPDKSVGLEGFPAPDKVSAAGIGVWLREPK
jgi:hypothetical protein